MRGIRTSKKVPGMLAQKEAIRCQYLKENKEKYPSLAHIKHEIYRNLASINTFKENHQNGS